MKKLKVNTLFYYIINVELGLLKFLCVKMLRKTFSSTLNI